MRNIDVFISDDILYVVAEGKWNSDMLKKAYKQVALKARDSKVKRYLIDNRRVFIDANIGDVLSFTFFIHENGGNCLDKAALLIPSNDEYHHRIYGIYKNSMTLKGHKLDLFFNEDEAVSWLHM